MPIRPHEVLILVLSNVKNPNRRKAFYPYHQLLSPYRTLSYHAKSIPTPMHPTESKFQSNLPPSSINCHPPPELSPSCPLHSEIQNEYLPGPNPVMGLQPEEIAHVITELSDTTISLERRRLLLRLSGVDSDESSESKDRIVGSSSSRGRNPE
ncbi:hypothetical protein V866_000495 [Kwoniella sp. B9012]